MHTPSESFASGDSKSLNTSTPPHEIDGNKRLETLDSIHNQESKDRLGKPSDTVDAELSLLKEASTYAEKHDFFGFKHSEEAVIDLLVKEAQQLEGSGLTLEDLMSDPATLLQFKAELGSDLQSHGEENEKAVRVSLEDRFQELQKSKDSVSSILQILKVEFGDSIGEETSAVLDKYSTLLSPEIFTDKEELEAVETLFYTQSGEFTAESFSNFVQTIYDQPDDLISEESKIKIEKAFNIPRTPIKTGKELAQATQLTGEDGSYVHNSEKNALVFRPGVKTHMNANGKAVLTLDGKSHSHPLTLPSEALDNGESIADYANYALVRQTVYKELGQLTNLFGGGQEDETSLPDSETMDKAKRFTELLIGGISPEAILTSENLGDLRSALQALHDPSLIGETESLNAMQDLGMLDNGNLQWSRVSEIGSILRENQYYNAFEMEKEGASHDLLSAEIKRMFPHGNIQKNKMSANRDSGHFLFYTWNWWTSRLFYSSRSTQGIYTRDFLTAK